MRIKRCPSLEANVSRFCRFKENLCSIWSFLSRFDYFNQPHVIELGIFEEQLSQWANHSAFTQLLQAFKLLSQLASSSCCEGNQSSYSNIQNMQRNKFISGRVIQRNKLISDKAKSLVYVHCNFCLMLRKEKSLKMG